MKKYLLWVCGYFLVLTITVGSAAGISSLITVFSEQRPVSNRKTVVIDAGHGGIDGGATSCSGICESQINLQIALRLNDLMHLLGIHTVMIRTDDVSIHTSGTTIAQKKISDLKERVRIANECTNSFLISIHQNYFSDSRYRGAQVFYSSTENSQGLAKSLQTALVGTINKGSIRQIKRGEGIYLLQHITCPGVLIECGFLSNPDEDKLLQTTLYQQKLCCVIASTCSVFLFNRST